MKASTKLKIIFGMQMLILTMLVYDTRATIFNVTITADNAVANSGSLRDCITRANADATGTHEIRFNIAGTFTVNTVLPSFSRRIHLNGTSAPGYAGNPLVEIVNGAAVNNGLDFNNPASNLSTVEAIVVRGFGGDGILLNGISSITIRNCRVGTTMAGTAASANAGSGIGMIDGGSHTIDGCLISGNTVNGIFAYNSTNNTIISSKIGTSLNGLNRIANGAYGILMMSGSNDNTIGGIGTGNIISGNTIHGIYIIADFNSPHTSPGSNNNQVYGNLIGVDATGNTRLSNGENGVALLTCTGTIIGGAVSGQGNVISGNGFSAAGVGTYNSGITIYRLGGQASMSTIIEGNLIGLGANGTTSIGNSGYGIYSNFCNDIRIGGINKKISRNIISSNGYGFSFNGPGVYIENGSNFKIFNNYIGTDSTGLLARPNRGSGLSLFTNASNNRIGGITADSLNVISGNNENGIYFHNNIDNVVVGNYIGVAKTGTAALANQVHGIYGDLTCLNHTIGGSTSGYRNIISANIENGIFYQSKSHDIKINGNYIGTNKNGTGPAASFGNGYSGVKLDSCERALIGVSAGNVISGNGQLYPGPGLGLNGSGLTILSGSTDAVIQNNIIGLEVGGAVAMGNKENGVILYDGCHNALVGGTSTQKNIISNNGFAFADPTGQGIVVHASHNVSIYGNYIGTDISGLLPRGNNQSGIIGIWSNNLSIGQAVAGKGNVIADNSELGIHLVGGNVVGTSGYIYNNNIGVGSNGITAMGNDCGGIYILGVTDGTAGTFGINYVVGGTASLQPNIIAYSTGTNTRFGNGYGIGVQGNTQGSRNTFIANKIFCNAGRGIDLNFVGSQFLAGFAPGNNGKTAPTLATSTGTVTTGTGINGETIHLYYNPSYVLNTACDCEGEIYLGSAVVAGGTWSITHASVGTLTTTITATATDLSPITNGTSQFTPCNPLLPVTLLSFEATRKSTSVLLTWATAKEENNNYFILERSSDGIHFQLIGRIEGNGNSSAIIDYNFTDPAPLHNSSYYRLKQVDFDGSTTYSKIISINITNEIKISIYPNPNEGRFILSFGASAIDYYEITLVNSLGQIIFEKLITGNENQEINIEALPAGIYYMTVVSDGEQFIEKVYRR